MAASDSLWQFCIFFEHAVFISSKLTIKIPRQQEIEILKFWNWYVCEQEYETIISIVSLLHSGQYT